METALIGNGARIKPNFEVDTFSGKRLPRGRTVAAADFLNTREQRR